MPRYRIERELTSVAFFGMPIDVVGFTLQSSGTAEEQRAYASSSAQGDTWREAVTDFEERLFKLLDAFAVARMIAVSTYGGSLLVRRDGAREALLIRMALAPDYVMFHPFDTVGMTEFEFGYMALLSADDRILNAIRHYRESLLYPSALVACMHLLRAAEALADQQTPMQTCRTCGASPILCSECRTEVVTTRTDQSDLRGLIGDEAYEFFYRRPGVRHAIMHGRVVSQERLGHFNEPLRTSVRAQLRSELGLSDRLPQQRDRSLIRVDRYPRWLETDGDWPDFQTLLEMDRAHQLSWTSDPRLVDPAEPERLDREY